MITLVAVLLGVLAVQNASLESASPKERQTAIEQLAVAGNTSAIPTLAAALKKEPKSDIRAVIVAGLARIQDGAAVPVLAETLASDPDKDVRLQVIDSIQRIYIPLDDPGPIQTVFNRVKSVFAGDDRPLVDAGVQVDPEATEALALAMQKDFNDAVRAAAARALGSLKAKDQLTVLLQTVEDPRQREHNAVRLEIVQSLGVIRDPAAGPALQRMLRDQGRGIREQAILSLGLVGYKEARPDLENLYRTESDRVIRRRALDSLSLIHDPESKPFFESILDAPDDHTREIAAEGLGRIRYDPALLKTRYDQEKRTNVRIALAFAMAAGGQDQYINELANALDSSQSFQAEVYLFELGAYNGKLGELHRYLLSSSPRIRARMARVLGNIGDPSSREKIQPLTQDNNVEVVREAVAALRKFNAR